MEHIKSRFPELNFIIDKPVKNGCSKRRPDVFLDCGTHALIIEIDENQHSDYDGTCEIQRVNDLFNDIGIPIVFIRFNPDEYVSEGKKITSCFDVSKTGVLLIKKSKQSEWFDRLQTLTDAISKNIQIDKNEFKNNYAVYRYLYYNCL